MPEIGEAPTYLKEGDFTPADKAMRQHLLDVIGSENLVVLTGSGTSLGPEMAALGAPSMWDLLEVAKGLEKYQEVQELSGAEPDDIEKFLSWCLLYIQLGLNGHEDVTTFYRAAEEAIRNKCDFLSEHATLDAHETFLAKLVRRTRDMPRVQLFTTNYDRAFEVAASNRAILALDGFDFSSKPKFSGQFFELDVVRRDEGRKEPEFIEDVFKLYKVHGSVDWDESTGSVIKTAKPADPAMIYPQSGKYEASYGSPFLDLMSRFQRALRLRNLGILVLGYGFRDRHLNNPLLLALRENRSLRIAVVDIAFSFESDDPEDPTEAQKDRAAAHDQLKRLADNNPNIVLLVKASFVEFAKFMPQYMTASEREQFEKAAGA